MQLHGKPLAFVDESGYIVPNPTFSTETLKHIKGRFIYTQAELKMAIDDMNRRTEERRLVADKYFGADAVRVKPDENEDIHEVITNFAGERETIPSFTAAPTAKRKSGGPSNKLTAPNEIPLPDTLDIPQKGINLTQEELDDFTGIDGQQAVAAMFGER